MQPDFEDVVYMEWHALSHDLEQSSSKNNCTDGFTTNNTLLPKYNLVATSHLKALELWGLWMVKPDLSRILQLEKLSLDVCAVACSTTTTTSNSWDESSITDTRGFSTTLDFPALIPRHPPTWAVTSTHPLSLPPQMTPQHLILKLYQKAGDVQTNPGPHHVVDFAGSQRQQRPRYVVPAISKSTKVVALWPGRCENNGAKPMTINALSAALSITLRSCAAYAETGSDWSTTRQRAESATPQHISNAQPWTADWETSEERFRILELLPPTGNDDHAEFRPTASSPPASSEKHRHT